MTKEQFIKYCNITDDQFSGREKIEGNLNLVDLTSIPEGFNPKVGDGLYLNRLTSIPEGFNPVVGGILNLNSLTSISEGFSPVVGGKLLLGSLTEIPENWNPTNINENIHIGRFIFDIKTTIKFMNFEI